MSKRKIIIKLFVGFVAFSMIGATLYMLNLRGRPAPVPMKENLFDGVTYRRKVSVYPDLWIAHILVIDMRKKGVSFLVTPPDNSGGEPPLDARTTSQFLKEYELQIAVNGDGFYPWRSFSPLNYYPHVGDPVTPNGFAASRRKVYSKEPSLTDGVNPTLYLNRRNYPSMGRRPGNVFNAVSGDRMLVQHGEPVDGLEDSVLNPRTAIGYNRNGRYLIIAVVDGRQPFYSNGVTLAELAQLMIDLGAHYAMNLDGGGSSTMVVEGKDGQPLILNSPIDNYIPGRERPVANHLGVYIKNP